MNGGKHQRQKQRSCSLCCLEALATFLLVNMIKIIRMLFKCAPSGPQKHKTKESDGLHI